MSTRPDAGDAAYVWDIRRACEEVAVLLEGQTLDTYLSSRSLQMAVERGLEIIGEASRRLSETFRLRHAEIRWSSIIGLRNTLAHGYGRINDARIWEIARYELPILSRQLADSGL